MRAGWSAEQIARVTPPDGEQFPVVDFVAEAECCAACSSPLRSYKSTKRLRPVMGCEAGPFIPREVLKQCSKDPSHPVARSEALALVVRPRQRYAYDLIVHVGLARYLRDKRREQIRAELYEQRRIELSDASVSVLCDRFLSYFEALHLLRAPALRAAMQPYGYPMHLDATNDRGRGGLLITMDGFRNWVLMSKKIPSEHSDHIRPLVEKTVALFGEPLATMRDLMKAGPRSVASIRKRGKPDLICHYHYLRAAGHKLFDESHSALQRMLKLSRVRPRAWELLRELRRYRNSNDYSGRFGSGAVREDLLALLLWVLEGDGKKKVLYPFALPQLDLFHRCRQAMQRAERWVPAPRSQPERRALRHLSSLMARVERDKRCHEVAGQLEKAWYAFSELRDVLRLTGAELPRGGEAFSHQKVIPAVALERMGAIEEATKEYRQRLQDRDDDQSSKRHRTPEGIILKYLDDYFDNLFGHPVVRDEDDAVVFVVERTDNICEHFFDKQKRAMRRRLGKAHLGRDLEDQPAQVALVANLHHDDYVRVLCGSLDNLANAFADLDQQALADATPLERNNRNSSIKRRVRLLLEQEAKTIAAVPVPLAAGAQENG